MSTPFPLIKVASLNWQNGFPYSTDDNIYFSQNPVDEKYVFIEGNTLIKRWQALPKDKPCHFIVAETRFSTALNFLLTWFLWEKYAPSTATLHYLSTEKSPLSLKDLKRCTLLWPDFSKQAESLIEVYPILTPGFHRLTFADGRINLTLFLGEALDGYESLLNCSDSILERELQTWAVDAWYLGFEPIKNARLYQVVSLLSKNTTTFSTYNISNTEKQEFEKVGFEITKRKGKGFAGKMLIPKYLAPKNKLQDVETALKRSTPWHISKPYFSPEKRVLIVGAGLAGCAVANALANRNWQVTLVDAANGVGQGASANPYAVLYPKLSAYRSPLTEYMLIAFLFAIRFYQALMHHHPESLIGELKGILQLPSHQHNAKAQESLKEWLLHYPELGQLVNAKEASFLTGLDIQSGGLFIKNTGWINPQRVCQLLVQPSRIVWCPQTFIEELSYADGIWTIGPYQAEVVILANGLHASAFSQTKHFPLKAMHGQMTLISETEKSKALKIPLCGEGHILPARNGFHGLGATYNPHVLDTRSYPLDNQANLEKLKDIPTETIWSQEVIGDWAGIRAAAPDYLPLVGPVPNAELFKNTMAGVATNSKRWIGKPGDYYPGLYVCAGFGSRGLTTIPLAAECLAGMINHEPLSLSRQLLQAISPARFLFRQLFRE